MKRTHTHKTNTDDKDTLEQFSLDAEVAVNAEDIPQRELTDNEMAKLADFILAFSQTMTGITLFPYQREFGWRIIYSILIEDAEEISALFARQSGKTECVAVVICGLIVMLPILATQLRGEPRLEKFSRGVWVGVFAPSYDQSAIMFNRMRHNLYSKASLETMLEPDIDMDLSAINKSLVNLPNGSFVDCQTAAVQANIEGKTYNVIIFEEAQDLNQTVVRSSIHPMAAALAGSLIKIGTCSPQKSDFYEVCKANKRMDHKNGLTRSRYRLHYQFDYTVAAMYNPRYAKSSEKDKIRFGEESDDFRMKYRLHWIMERGMFITEEAFDECGIQRQDQLEIVVGKGRRQRKVVFKRPSNVVNHDSGTPKIVASIDVGKEKSTVVTIGKVFWDNPIKYGDSVRFPIHVYNWLELYGDDHEKQHPQIMNFLKNYRLSDVIIDATGKGDPIYSRIKAELEEYDIMVHSFIFSTTSKETGYKILQQELSNHRLTYPAGERVSKMKKYDRFYGQVCSLLKFYRGNVMVVERPKDDKDSADDYPDSLMMLSWLVNVGGTMEIEVGPNPFVGRNAKWAQADMLKKAQSWFRAKVNPYGSYTNKRKASRKWD